MAKNPFFIQYAFQLKVWKQFEGTRICSNDACSVFELAREDDCNAKKQIVKQFQPSIGDRRHEKGRNLVILQNGKSCAKVMSRTFLRMTGRRLVAGTKSKRTTAEKQELEPRAKKTAAQIVRTQCRKIRCKHCQNEAASELDASPDRKEAQRFCAIFLTHTHTHLEETHFV